MSFTFWMTHIFNDPRSASRIHGSPEPPLPVIAERVMPKVSFKELVRLMVDADLASKP